MRKLLSLLGLMYFVCIGLQAQQTMFVQGVPRQVSTLPKALKVPVSQSMLQNQVLCRRRKQNLRTRDTMERR